MTKSEHTITTEGDYSPGFVGGNYVINQTIVNQYDKSQRKTWRPLDELVYHTKDDSPERRFRYLYQLLYQLHCTYEQRGFIEFTSFASLRRDEAEGETLTYYCLLSHQVKFTGNARKVWRYLWDSPAPETEKVAYANRLYEGIADLENHWTLNINWFSKDYLAPIHFVYDSDARRISVGQPATISSNPADYPSKVTTTSELFCFLAAYHHNRFHVVDLDVVRQCYPLQKLYGALLNEKKWEPDRIRVNLDDPEEWDYLNPALDAEIRSYQARRGNAGEAGRDQP